MLIFTTGGTIDKCYFDALSKYEVAESCVPALLKIARVTTPFEVIELLRKDSLDITGDDRTKIVTAAETSFADRIVITHGTDSIVETAAALSNIKNKTIVLVGALAPARFSESDAAFNLGMAFATAQLAEAGVYITMNGRVFAGHQVRKDRSLNSFVHTEMSDTEGKSREHES